MSELLILILLTLFAPGLGSSLDCFHSENIECVCSDDSLLCTGIQEDWSEVELMFANVSNFYSTSNLLYLSLNIQDLTFPQNFTFEHLNQLKNITLGTGLRSLQSGIFSGLGSTVISLNLEYNSLEPINNSPFSELYHLEELNLNSNGLTEVNQSAFYNLSQLKLLSLAGNNFNQLHSDLLNNLPSIQTLVVNRNNITSVSDINIRSLTLVNLTVKNCFMNGSLSKESLHGISNLQYADMSYNRLTGIDSYSLAEMKGLKTLNLTNNAMEYLRNYALASAYNLQSLDLSYNKLVLVREKAFLNLTKLKYLDLSGNSIEAFLREYTVDLLSLEMISLQDNKIKVISSGTFSESPHLREISLSGNQLHCTCDLAHFERFLAYNSYTQIRDKKNPLICAAPPNMKGVPLADVDFLSLKCHFNELDPEGTDEATTEEVPPSTTTYLGTDTTRITTNEVRKLRSASLVPTISQVEDSTESSTSISIKDDDIADSETSSTIFARNLQKKSFLEPFSPVNEVASTERMSTLPNIINTESSVAASTERISTLPNTEPYILNTESSEAASTERISTLPNTEPYILDTESSVAASTERISTLPNTEPYILNTESSEAASTDVSAISYSTDSEINMTDVVPQNNSTPQSTLSDLTDKLNDEVNISTISTGIESDATTFDFSTQPLIAINETVSESELDTEKSTLVPITEEKATITTAFNTETVVTSEDDFTSIEMSITPSTTESGINITDVTTETDLTTLSAITDLTVHLTDQFNISTITMLALSSTTTDFSTQTIPTNDSFIETGLTTETGTNMPITEQKTSYTSLSPSTTEKSTTQIITTAVSVRIANYTISNKLCIIWTIEGAHPNNLTCRVSIKSFEGSRGKRLQCPTEANEISQCLPFEDVYSFCIIVEVDRKTKAYSCKTYLTETTSMQPVTSTYLSKVITTPTIIPFEITEFDAILYPQSSAVFVTWRVSSQEPTSVCHLKLQLTTTLNYTEGKFKCTNGSYTTYNTNGEVSSVCILSFHKIYKEDAKCKSFNDPHLGFQSSRTKDDGYKNSSLIAVICLLIIVLVIVVILVMKNILKKRTESDRYNVSAEEQNVQKRSFSNRPEPCVRYSYTQRSLKQQEEL